MRRSPCRFRTSHAVVEFPNRLCGGESEEETLCGIDDVIREILALQPRVAPLKTLVVAKRFQHPFFRNQIDSADEQLRLRGELFEREGPAFKHPIRLLISTMQMPLRMHQEFLLDLQGRP